MVDRPENVAYAAGMLLWHEPDDESLVSDFTGRCGGLDPDNLVRALGTGSDEDRLFAIFALGYLGTPEVRERLLTILGSDNPLERWAAAICLGWMGEPRAVPALCAMLTEFLLPGVPLRTDGTEEWLYFHWREYVPLLLGRLGDPVTVPPLRQALRYLLELDGPWSELPGPGDAPGWSNYEHQIVYAVGRLGAFGALTGIENGEVFVPVWRVVLIMGYMHNQLGPGAVITWREKPDVKARVTALLERCFGLSAEERDRCLSLYARSAEPRIWRWCERDAWSQGRPY